MVGLSLRFRVMVRLAVVVCVMGAAVSLLAQGAKTTLVMPPCSVVAAALRDVGDGWQRDHG